MKRLLTGTALLTICAPMIAYAAGATDAAPIMAPDGASRVQAAPEGAESTMSSDPLTHLNGVATV